jgi:aminopeptidase YwaD
LSSTVIKHLNQLLAYGSRPIGSPANQAAAEYIHASYQAAGLEVEDQPYDCTGWRHHSTQLKIEGERLPADANAFSLACDLSAKVVSAGSIAELERVHAKDRILLLYGDLVRAPLSPKSWFLKDDRSVRIIDLMETLQPAAILAPPTATDYFCYFTEDWELDFPAASIPPEVALRLMSSPNIPVELKIEAARFPETAVNIIARTLEMKAKRLVICAHFDTKINSAGATDNGGGVAALLALAESLPRDLPFGIEFVAFNGEEYLPIGDDEYIRRSEDYFGQILACINIDGAGAALGSNNITAIACPDELEKAVRAVTEQFPGVVWTDPWPESNHSTFSFRGIPAIPIGASGTRGLAHSIEDTIEQVSAAKLEEVISLVSKLVNQLAQRAA